MKFSFVAVGLLLAANIVLAQNVEKKIVARVLTAEGQPIANANVRIAGSKARTETNAKGFFELTVPADADLVISHIGYSTKQVKVQDTDKFQVNLNREIVLLETITLTTYPKKVVSVSPAPAPYDSVKMESMASFPKGMTNFYALAGNALYAEFKDYKGPLNIVFTVDESGKMTDIEAPDSTLNKVIASDWKYMPAWTPAIQKDVKVPQRFLLPVIATEPDDFYKHITDNMIIPPKARRQGIDGRYAISFIANVNGTISDFTVIQDLGADYEIEVRRVLTSTPPEIVKSLINRTGAKKFVAIFRFELYPGVITTDLTYPSVTPEQFILGELSITAVKQRKPEAK